MGMDTYKYVNAHGTDDNDKAQALIYLMRAYMAANQYDNAKTVGDHIEKLELTEKNKALFFITKAEYLWKFEEYDKMIPLLEEAAPMMQKRDIRSRMYFILGQLYQQKGNDTLAYKNYHKVVKSNPPYEMLFVAKLNLYQVTSIDNAASVKKLQKYYAKLLKDIKNEEYKDKIYYERALFEYKQNKLPEAIADLKRSAKEGKTGGYQKGFTFLKLAEIYYEDLEDYVNAAAYYDSTAATFDKKDKRYPLIFKREKVLDEFVLHLNTIQREDSLLRVSKMDSVTLNNLIDTLIAKEQAAYRAQQLALKKQKEDAENAALNGEQQVTAITNADPNAKSWYFSNTVAVQNGQVDFNRKWGKRKLEDHWRRSRKEAIVDYDAINRGDSTAANTTPPEDAVSEGEKNDIPPLKIDRQKYLVDIPFTDEQKVESNKKIEDALFHVANIYNHKLDEIDRAIRTYKKLLERYPKTDYEPEVLYNLYLIYKDKKDEKNMLYYKNILFEKHPNSIYSKLIQNPNYYRDTKIANKFAEADYKSVYDLYKSNNFENADSLASEIIAKYPNSDIIDRLTYLKILCKIKMNGPTENVRAMIDAFPVSFPESPLLPLIENLSTAIDKQKKQQETSTPSSNELVIPPSVIEETQVKPIGP
jgi:tetratricopeptide (TPR) repeat protein